MRNPWKVIRFRIESIAPGLRRGGVEAVLAETASLQTAKICCENLHRFMGRQSESWYIQSPDGKRYQMGRAEITWDEVEIGAAPPQAPSLTSAAPSARPQPSGGELRYRPQNGGKA